MKTTFDTHFMFIYSYVVSDVNYMKEKRNYVHIYCRYTVKTTLAMCINYHYLRIS